MVLLFLTETHPSIRVQPGLGVAQRLTKMLGMRWSNRYTILADHPDDHCIDPDDEEHLEGSAHRLRDLSRASRAREVETSDHQPSYKTMFETQVILQILSLCILAFHKVSSDAIMPVFLAENSSPAPSHLLTIHDPVTSGSGFGYSSKTIGFILLTQAIIGLITQATVVPIFIDKLGALVAYRIVLGIYPAVYIFTPFIPKLSPSLRLCLITLDLWSKVILSSVGYICSAIL